MDNNHYLERINKLTFPTYLGRLFGGLMFNWLDHPGLFGGAIGALIAGKYGFTFFSLGYLASQIYLATKGYTVSKLILGRKVLSNKTLEKANPAIIMIRPIMAQLWMGCMMGLYFAFTLFGAAFASIFHRRENTVYDVAYNNAMTTSMAAGSAGLLTSVFVKFPKLVWLHDTLTQTIVVSVPYSQIKEEIFDKNHIESYTLLEKSETKQKSILKNKDAA